MSSSTSEAPKSATLLKRSLFNKPAWSKPEIAPSSDDFFHRSKQTYVDVATEQELKRKKKQARKERERAHRTGSEERGKKRRRICDASDDDEDEEERDSSDESVASSHSKSRSVEIKQPAIGTLGTLKSTGPTPPTISPRSLVKRYETTVAAAKREQSVKINSDVIDLEGDEESDPGPQDDEHFEVTAVKVVNPRPPKDEALEFSDEEFPELARKAREKARRKRLQADIENLTPDAPPVATQDAVSHLSFPTQQSIPQPPPPDPVVRLLITSRIPNTEPLILSRKISQRLKEVRLTWCHKQGFTPDVTAKVLLVWRGKRMFDITSCKSLGIGIDVDGNIVTKGQKDILGEENRQIHMEAMTEEIFDQIKKAKAQNADNDILENQIEEVVAEKPKPDPQVKIILKAKGFDDFKLIVKSVSLAHTRTSAIPMTDKLIVDRDLSHDQRIPAHQ